VAFFIGRDREARRAYGFDEVALVPGLGTINPEDCDASTKIGSTHLKIPIIASAMDGVVDVKFAIEMSKLGGLAVLNSEGIQTRYENPEEILQAIVSAGAEEATSLLQKVYKEPIKEDLLAKRIKQIKKAGGKAAISSIPKRAERFAEIALHAGADFFFIQSTVTSSKHESSNYASVDFSKICKKLAKKIPVIIGNCVTYSAALSLMEAGGGAGPGGGRPGGGGP